MVGRDMTRDLFTGRWHPIKIQKLARRAVFGQNAYRYYRWSARNVRPDWFIEPSFDWMMDALASGGVSPYAKDAESQLVHGARCQFADWALQARRYQQARTATGARSLWMPEYREDNLGRPRPPEETEDREIRRLVESLTVRHMLLACKQEDFEVLDAYFNGDGYGQRAAARELSRRLGRHVSVGEYNQVLTETRLNLIEWLSGGVRLPAESLGRWPDARVWAGRRGGMGDGAVIAGMLDEVRQLRRIS
jgi:hypothetical protein